MDWKQLGIEIFAILIPTISVALLSVVTWAVGLLAKKFKLDVNLRNNSMLRIAARTAVAGAEEWAARKAKEAIVGDPIIPSSDKLQHAVTALAGQFARVAPEELERVIHEELAATKGVGATGEKAIGAD